MSTIHLQVDGLDAFKSDVRAGAGDIKKQVRWAMIQSVNVVKNSAQTTAPYKTGTLRRSIYTNVSDSGFEGIVAQDSSIAPYGVMVEYGTRAHVIEPRSKQALFWKGARNPYRRVQHPGTQARPYMFPALTGNLDAIKDYFSKACLNIVLKMAGKAV